MYLANMMQYQNVLTKHELHLQLWSKTMQDLGVCEELGYLDEQSIPDIDLTFQNFEELFGGGEQEPTQALVNDLSQRCTTFDKDIPSDNLEHECASGMEV